MSIEPKGRITRDGRVTFRVEHPDVIATLLLRTTRYNLRRTFVSTTWEAKMLCDGVTIIGSTRGECIERAVAHQNHHDRLAESVQVEPDTDR